MGVHPHAPMKGVQTPCPLLVPVFREAYDRGPSRPRRGEPPCSVRGRLQSVDPTIERSSTRARPKSRLRAAPRALAPPGAHSGRACGCALASVERESGRTTRKKSCASGGQRTPSLVASLLPWVTTAPSYQSRKGGTDPSPHSQPPPVRTNRRGAEPLKKPSRGCSSLPLSDGRPTRSAMAPSLTDGTGTPIPAISLTLEPSAHSP